MSKRFFCLCVSLAVAVLSGACSKKPAPATEAPQGASAKPLSDLLGSSDSAPAAAPPPASAAPAADATSSAVATTSAASANASTPGAVTPNERQIIEDIQAALSDYYVKNVNSVQTSKKAPRSLDELVRAGLIKSIPAPPPGKKIVYHPENWQVTIE